MKRMIMMLTIAGLALGGCATKPGGGASVDIAAVAAIVLPVLADQIKGERMRECASLAGVTIPAVIADPRAWIDGLKSDPSKVAALVSCALKIAKGGGGKRRA